MTKKKIDLTIANILRDDLSKREGEPEDDQDVGVQRRHRLLQGVAAKQKPGLKGQSVIVFPGLKDKSAGQDFIIEKVLCYIARKAVGIKV